MPLTVISISSISDMVYERLNIFRGIMALLLCLFGLPGNFLTMIVCVKALRHRASHVQHKVFHLYLLEISILGKFFQRLTTSCFFFSFNVDTCMLLYMIVETVLLQLFENDQIQYFSLMHISPFSCYFSYLFNRLCAALCAWSITCFTFLRFINVFRRFNTIRSNFIIVISLFLIISLLNSYSIIVLDYRTESKLSHNLTLLNYSPKHLKYLNYPTVCNIRAEYADNRAILLINVLVAGVFNLGLPSILILIVNIVTLYLIKNVYLREPMMKRRRSSTNSSYRSTRSTLLIISITYTLFYIPYLLLYFVMIFVDDESGMLFIGSQVAYILRHVSHSVNFYAYTFTSVRLRREISKLFYCSYQGCFKKSRPSSYSVDQRTILPLILQQKFAERSF